MLCTKTKLLEIIVCTIFQYQHEFSTLYSRPDFVGRLAQQILSPPHRTQTTPDKALSPVSRGTQQALTQPRLRLRWLASYQNMVYFVVLYLLMYLLWGFGPVTYLFLMVLLAFVWCSLKAAFLGSKVKYPSDYRKIEGRLRDIKHHVTCHRV